MLEHDEYDEELHDEQEHEVSEQHEHEELRLDIEVEVINEHINLAEVMEAELMDMDEVDDGGEVTEVYEIVVLMMINEDEEEVDM